MTLSRGAAISAAAGRWSGRGKKTAKVSAGSRPRRLERSARAVLFWGLLFYALFHLIPISLLVSSTEFPWHAVGTAIEARKWPKLWQLVATEPNRPLLLMLGSSRLCWALRAGALDGMPDSDGRPLHAFNFGIPTRGPIHQLLYLRDLLAEGIRPRFLLIEFNPTLLCAHQRDVLNEEDMMGIETISARRFLQWLPFFDRPGEKACVWLAARGAPWYIFRRQIKLQVKYLVERRPCPTYEPIDDWGWHIPFSNKWPIDERLRRLAMAHHEYSAALRYFRWGERPTQALRELLDLCRQDEIPAALVVMPESSVFRSWYSEDANRAIDALLDELRQTFGVAVIDANCWLADEDFEDGHHVLLHGADVFTCRLHAEIVHLLAK
jgi:hypothetical protein